MCITETHLSPEINDAEIFIENFTIFRGDRRDGRDKGGSVIYVHNNLPCTRIDDFNPNDSLAILIDLPNFQLAIACVYRSQSITEADNLSMIEKINSLKTIIPCDSELMLVGDFNLPNVSWDTATVICPPETRNKFFKLQKKFVDMFLDAGLFWHLPDGTTTRRRMYDGVLQESHLDQVFTSDPATLLECELISALGNSDHLGVLSRVKCSNLPGYYKSEKKCWSKMSPETIESLGTMLNWDSPQTARNVDDMWKHITEQFDEITAKVPTMQIKTSSNGTTYIQPPWDCTALKQGRREKMRHGKHLKICQQMKIYHTHFQKVTNSKMFLKKA